MNVKTAPPMPASFDPERTPFGSAERLHEVTDLEGVTPTLVVDDVTADELEERLLLADLVPPDEMDGALRYDADAIAAHYQQQPLQVW